MNDTTKLNIPELLANPDYIVVSEYRTKKLFLPYWFGIELKKGDVRFYSEMGIDALMRDYPDLVTLISIIVRHPKYNEMHYGRVCYRCVAYHA